MRMLTRRATKEARLAANLGLIAVLLGACSPTSSDGLGGSTSPSAAAQATSGVASASPIPPEAKPDQTATASFWHIEGVMGDRLEMHVWGLGPNNTDCTSHGIHSGNLKVVIFLTDCSSWERDGYDIVLFSVELRNRSREAVRFHLRSFALEVRGANVYVPVNVRSKAETPPRFLPENAVIPPHASLKGYLTFDGRVSFVPKALSYLDGRQTLTVNLDGKPYSFG
jgi:hypothetical protein